MGFFQRFRKPAIPVLPQGAAWIQGGPYTTLRGEVTCLFFFSYANMACVRTFSFFERLSKYNALRVIGVHVPEYEFEAEEVHVRAALQHYGITAPILLDHNFEVCAQFQNQWLPRFIVIGADGVIAHDHIGEGGHAEIERAIQHALLKAGETNLPDIGPDEVFGGGLCYRTTNDILLGYTHTQFETKEETIPFEEVAYTQGDAKKREGAVLLHGHFRLEKDYVEHTRSLPLASEFLAVFYSAFSVNIVAAPLRHGVELFIDLDGRPVPQDVAGEDISYNKEGQSIVKLDFPRAYRIIDADTYHRGQLKVRMKDADIRCYALIFGGCRNM